MSQIQTLFLIQNRNQPEKTSNHDHIKDYTNPKFGCKNVKKRVQLKLFKRERKETKLIHHISSKGKTISQ